MTEAVPPIGLPAAMLSTWTTTSEATDQTRCAFSPPGRGPELRKFTS